MHQLDYATKLAARVLAVIGLGVLLCFAAATIADGLLRFLFARPIDAVRDVGGLVAAFAVASCIPAAIVERSNITVRFVSSFISPAAGRIADIAAAVLVTTVLALMAWQFVVFAQQAQANAIATWMLRIPAAPFWWTVAGMLWISVLLQIVVTIRCMRGDYADHGSDLRG